MYATWDTCRKEDVHVTTRGNIWSIQLAQKNSIQPFSTKMVSYAQSCKQSCITILTGLGVKWKLERASSLRKSESIIFCISACSGFSSSSVFFWIKSNVGLDKSNFQARFFTQKKANATFGLLEARKGEVYLFTFKYIPFSVVPKSYQFIGSLALG